MRILLPWKILGCLGIEIGEYYADIYKRWGRWYNFGIFISTPTQVFRILIPEFKIKRSY